MQAKHAGFKSKVKRTYEWGRLRYALRWSIPTLVLGGLVALIVRQMSWPLTLGMSLYVASVVLLWVGKSAGRSVLPGVVYGMLPLTGGLISRFNGHVCLGLSCYSSCLLYCVSGGVAAGLLVARLAAKSDAPAAVFMSAAATSLLTGAIGISCVGVHGLIGMAAGVTLGAIPQGLRWALRRAENGGNSLIR
jgi:hypothetical protein